MDPLLVWLIVAVVLAVAEIFTLTAALGMFSWLRWSPLWSRRSERR